jgi:hypothetical protein
VSNLDDGVSNAINELLAARKQQAANHAKTRNEAQEAMRSLADYRQKRWEQMADMRALALRFSQWAKRHRLRRWRLFSSLVPRNQWKHQTQLVGWRIVDHPNFLGITVDGQIYTTETHEEADHWRGEAVTSTVSRTLLLTVDAMSISNHFPLIPDLATFQRHIANYVLASGESWD